MVKRTKFKDTEIGLIPEDWRTDLLGNNTKIIKGISYRSGDYCSEEEGYIFINLKCVARNGGFRENGIKYYKGEVKEEQFVSAGDIIIANTDLTQNREIIGSPLKIPALNKDQRMCISLDLSKLSITNKKLDADFLYYYLMSPRARNFMIANSNGTTVIHLSTKNVPNMTIPLPPLPEQRVIAKILSGLDSKIELLQKQNETLEKIGQAIFKHWFVDFEFPNEEGNPYKSSGGEMIYNEELGKEIPKGWRVSKIGDELKTILGGTPSRVKKEYWTNGTIPWINSGKINEFRIVEPTEYITEDALKNSATKLLPKGTIVVAITGATLGQVSRLEIDSCANQSVVGILENKHLKSSFILYLLKAIIKEIIKKQTGGAQQHINKNNINETSFVIPSKSILDRYYNVTDNILHKISTNCFQIQTLQKTRDLLLPKLMSGKIRVPVEIEHD